MKPKKPPANALHSFLQVHNKHRRDPTIAKTVINAGSRGAAEIFTALAADSTDLSVLMIGATHIKTCRIAANGIKKGLR